MRRGLVLLAALAFALPAAGCAQSVPSQDKWFERGGGAPRALPGHADAAPDMPQALPRGAPGGDGAQGGAKPAAAHVRWGLAYPLSRAPRPPAVKPVVRRAGGLPAVVDRIPVKDKIVFLTIDDGIEKDPEFLKLARDLELPFSMFLTDNVASDDYGYFARLHSLGNPVHNHTLTHPNLTKLGMADQRRQICGQQAILKRRFGTAPAFFRPPYGLYDTATLEAAASCGIRALALWEADMKLEDFEYNEDSRLRPGDIVLAHFRGPEQQRGRTMTEMVTAMLRSIQRQGFAIARLEDYL